MSDQSLVGSCCSFSLRRSRACLSSRSWVSSPAHSSASTSGISRSAYESCSPLDSFPALYSSASARTSYCRRSPSIAPSCASSHARFFSPVLRSRRSQSRSRSHTCQSPSAGAGSLQTGLLKALSRQSGSSQSPSKVSSRGKSAFVLARSLRLNAGQGPSGVAVFAGLCFSGGHFVV